MTSSQDYLRASLHRDGDGTLVAAPFGRQDSSMLAVLARSGALVVRPPFAPVAVKGEACDAIPLIDI